MCGGVLVRTSLRARCKERVLREAVPEAQRADPAVLGQIDAALEDPALLGRASVGLECDVCKEGLAGGARSAVAAEAVAAAVHVYTCSRGCETMWHPTGCDVCEKCYARFAVDGGGA